MCANSVARKGTLLCVQTALQEKGPYYVCKQRCKKRDLIMCANSIARKGTLLCVQTALQEKGPYYVCKQHCKKRDLIMCANSVNSDYYVP